MQLAPNLVIAERFRLNRQLGRGGMGSVWHATHLGLDIPCAVKFIEGEYAQLPEAQARFEREAKAAAQLRSPHVVQILDHGVWQGTPYIAMELLDGEDLGKRILRVGRMNPRELIVIMTQVSRALTKAHSLNIVHRDLKPDNIFLVRDDDREIAKVLDFGIAKSNHNALEGSNTKTGAMLGTPYYMSPEQAQGIKSVDYRADLWSLAVICYQCVTGQLPFQSEALGDLLVKIIVSPIPVPSQVAPDVTMGFDKWWAKAAARDPAQRFQTSKEFADSLSLVFGLSQMTDVMDRNQVRAAIASHHELMNAPNANTPMPGGNVASTMAAPMVTPPGYAQTPQPGMGTPQPGAPQPLYGMGGTPQPGMRPNTPQPGYTTPLGANTPMQGSAPPIARTFNGSEIVPQPPKKGGLAVVLGIGAVVLVGGGLALAFALKGGGSANAGPGTDSTGTAAATATTSATAMATATATASATASATTTASAAPTQTVEAKNDQKPDSDPKADPAGSSSAKVAVAPPPPWAAKTGNTGTTGHVVAPPTTKVVPTGKPVPTKYDPGF